jgi:hypothetical protein
MKKSTKKVIRNVAIGTGVAAVVSAAAYALKDNPKVKKVAQNMKKEIIAQAKKAKVASKVAYQKIAKEVSEKYKKATHADVWSLIDAGQEVKSAWEHIKEVATQATKEVRKDAKKAAGLVTKAVKKSTGKSTK